MLRNLSEHICRQQKFIQNRIRGKTSISLEDILNPTMAAEKFQIYRVKNTEQDNYDSSK